LAAGLVAGAIIQWTLFSGTPSAPSVAPPAAPVATVPPATVKIEPAPAPTSPVAAAEPSKEPEKKAEPTPPPVRPLGKDQQRRFAGYSPRGQKLLAGRLEATRELLERASDEHYALELF